MNLEETKNDELEEDEESTPSKGSTLEKEVDKETEQLKLDLIEIDKHYHYKSFKNKEDFEKAYTDESNWISEEVEEIKKSRKEAITIKNKKLIKETMKDFIIHNLTLQPIENTKLTSIHGVCYNKNIGKSMETSLLLEIHKDVKSMKSDITTLKDDIKELKVNMVEVKKDIVDIKDRLTVVEKDVAVLKTDVTTLKTDVAQLKTGLAEVKVDLAETKIKNNLK